MKLVKYTLSFHLYGQTDMQSSKHFPVENDTKLCIGVAFYLILTEEHIANMLKRQFAINETGSDSILVYSLFRM